MTPAAESAYLRTLADEIEVDERYGHTARLITPAILRGRAAEITRKDQT